MLALQTYQFDVTKILCLGNQFVAILLYLLCHKLLYLFLETGVLVYRTTDGARQIRSIVEQVLQTVKRVLRGIVQFVCFRCRDGLDTTHTGCY